MPTIRTDHRPADGTLFSGSLSRRNAAEAAENGRPISHHRPIQAQPGSARTSAEDWIWSPLGRLLFPGDTGTTPIILRVKDFAGPCDCIKDSDGSRPVKKTRIDSTPSANPNSLRVLERVDASKCK